MANKKISGLNQITNAQINDNLDYAINNNGNSLRIKESQIKNDVRDISDLSLGSLVNATNFLIENSGAPERITFAGLESEISAGTKLLNVLTRTTDYNILDNDGYDLFEANHGAATKLITFTLPTLTDNIGRVLRFKNLATGYAKIDGEGAETIDGKAALYLFGASDELIIVAGSTEWVVLSYSMYIDSGYINTNDWTDRDLGFVAVDYNNLVGAFAIGEIITEAVSGNKGTILSDNGSTLILYNVTGGGVFTNTRGLTGGQSGATATVNEGTGSTKNLDSDIYHGTGYNLSELLNTLIVSTDATENNSFEIFQFELNRATTHGYTIFQTNTNSLQLQTGGAGIGYVVVGGGSNTLETENWYYKNIVENRR
jgi:hypothetical protein